MKRLTCLALSTILVFALVSCSHQNADGNTASSTSGTQNSSTSQATAESTKQNEPTPAATGTPEPTREAGNSENINGNGNSNKEEPLQSMSADLDADGNDESIEALKITIKSNDSNANTLEGHLRIKGSGATRDIVFTRKSEGLTGVMTTMDIRDLDGDGAKDIVVVVPDLGAAFSLNYFYLYSFKKDKSFSYSSDSDLADFAGSFSFKYAGSGILEIANSKYGFKGKINIVNKNRGVEANDENNSIYEKSWVEPVPVEINENSKLTVNRGSDGQPEIKVPLPVFGQATSDMIGEVDVFYRVDDNFKAYMHHFQVFDYSETGPIKVGEAAIKN